MLDACANGDRSWFGRSSGVHHHLGGISRGMTTGYDHGRTRFNVSIGSHNAGYATLADLKFGRPTVMSEDHSQL
jgi:hypothetical protein